MQTIRFERDSAVGRIVLANPPFNRLDLRFPECLRQAVHDASESDVRVVLIKAEGPHFSFGGEVREWPGKDINWFRTFVAEVNLSYRAIEALRVPTIAAVQGVAFGAKKLATGPTKSYAATRTLLKAWSAGGVPAADAVMLDIAMELFNTDDCTRGFLNTAKAFDLEIEPPDMVFNGH